MSIPASPTCSHISGPTMSCARVSNTKIKFTYSSISATTGFSASINQLVNYMVADQAVTFKLEIYNSENFLMEQHTAYQLTYSESVLTTVTVNNNDNIALGEASNVTLTVTNSFSLYTSLDVTKTKIVIKIPTGFTAAGDCVSTQGTCSLVGSQYEVTSAGKTLTNVAITMRGIVLGYFDPASGSF